jgi:hypothetical protein
VPKSLGSIELDPIAAMKSSTLYIERKPYFLGSIQSHKFASPFAAIYKGEGSYKSPKSSRKKEAKW